VSDDIHPTGGCHHQMTLVSFGTDDANSQSTFQSDDVIDHPMVCMLMMVSVAAAQMAP